MLNAFPALAQLLRWLLFRASDAFVISMIIGGGVFILAALELEVRSPEFRASIRTWSRERLSNKCALLFLFAIPGWLFVSVLPVRPAIRHALEDTVYSLLPLIGLRLVLAWVYGRWGSTRTPSIGIEPPAT